MKFIHSLGLSLVIVLTAVGLANGFIWMAVSFGKDIALITFLASVVVALTAVFTRKG